MWNDVVKCIYVYKDLEYYNFVPGKYYQIVNGHIIDGSGRKSCNIYTDIHDLNEGFYAKFEVNDNAEKET